MSGSRQRLYLAWAERVFGSVARRLDERVVRALEEMIELAQSVGVKRDTVLRLVGRVYGKEPGDSRLEFGQTMCCLEAVGEVMGLSADDEAETVWLDVQKLDPAWLRQRHDAKVALGIAKGSYEETGTL